MDRKGRHRLTFEYTLQKPITCWKYVQNKKYEICAKRE